MSANNLLTIKEASLWASKYLNKNITVANISYLIQYGRVKKYFENGSTSINKNDLEEYYKDYNGYRESNWREKLGNNLNWTLSFDYLKEKDTTKHVHRLHPYKGKFIPQLVEYFIDEHTDKFKREVYFKKEDIILDPFCGSGTTMVQANELGINCVGVDISAFNSLISNIKVSKFSVTDLANEIDKITTSLKKFISKNNNIQFEKELLNLLTHFNKENFPAPRYKIMVINKKINEQEYSKDKLDKFLPIFEELKKKYKLETNQEVKNNFLDKWYLEPIRKEIDFVFSRLKKIDNIATKKLLTVILSRTMRSCRATTHADLATLREPITKTYYCKKHSKICKPLFSIFSWWQRYSKDTLSRLKEFENLRTDTFQKCIQADARNVDLFAELSGTDPDIAQQFKQKKIKGIFSSPPYVGLINYHEQHAYAYDLFDFKRYDDLEIGPLFKGQGLEARKSYIEGVSQVLINAKKFMQDDFDVFLIANDKYNMYPTIAEKAGMQIVNQFKRPVLNRTEKNKNAYSEIIFHLKKYKYATNQPTKTTS